MTTTKNDILGRPIHGDVSNYSYTTPVPQKGPEKFLEALDGFLAKYPFVTFIRWSQGTPGFNDGEPCTFDLNSVRFGLGNPERDWEEDIEEADDYNEDYGDTSFDSYALFDYGDVLETGRYERIWVSSLGGVEIPEDFADEFSAFADEWPAYSDLFQEKFGDPAEITATREGFNVEYYEIGH